MLLSYNIRLTHDICTSMYWKDYANGNKTEGKRQVPGDFTHIWKIDKYNPHSKATKEGCRIQGTVDYDERLGL